MGESVGQVSLDLVIVNKLKKQVNDAVNDAKDILAKDLSVDVDVGNKLEDSLKKSVESCKTELQDAMDGITFHGFDKKEISPQSEMPSHKNDDGPIGSGLSAMAQTGGYLEKQLEAVKEKAYEIPEVFRAAEDPLERLLQKQELIEMQIASTTESLSGMTAEYAKMEANHEYGADFDKLGDSITKAQSKLVSLQDSLDATKKKAEKLGGASNLDTSGTEKLKNEIEDLKKKVSDLKKQLADTGKKVEKKEPKKNDSDGKKPNKGLDRELNGAKRKVTSFFAGIKKAAVVAPILAVVAGLFKGIKNLTEKAISGNLELQKSLSQIKGNLQVAFQPIIDVITPLLDSLLKKLAAASQAFAAFVAKIFGTTYDKAKANAKKLEAVAKSTKNLLSIDELNVRSNSSSDLDYLDGANYDTSWIDNVLKKLDGVRNFFAGVKDWAVVNFGDEFETAASTVETVIRRMFKSISGVFDDIKKLGPSLGDWFKKDFPKMFESGINLTTHIFEGLSERLDRIFNDIWSKSVFPIIENFVNEGLPRLTEFATEFTETLDTAFSNLEKNFDEIWPNISEDIEMFSEIFNGALNTIGEVWDERGAPIFEDLRTAIDNIGTTFSNLWENILKPIWDKISSAVKELWDEYLQPLWNSICEFVASLIENILAFWNNCLYPVVNWIIEKFGGPIVNFVTRLVDIIKNVIGAIIKIVDGVLKFFRGVLDFFTNIFKGDWDKAWESIKSAFKGIWEGIVEVLKTIVNILIGVLNTIIGGIYDGVVGFVNGILGGIEDVARLFGKDWDIKLPEKAPQIPLLAKGGIVNQPTLAMIGEAGKEAVVPLENNTGWMEAMAAVIVNALREVLQNYNSAEQDNEDDFTPVTIDGDVVIGWLRKRAKQWKIQTGYNLI